MTRRPSASFYTIFPALMLLIGAGCKKEPFVADFSNSKGYVIGKETCHSDETMEYWLVDFTYDPNSRQIGDTLVLNGIRYTNVVKLRGLDQRLQQIGMRVSIDYKQISSGKITNTGCDVSAPVTYALKEMIILNQGEIR